MPKTVADYEDAVRRISQAEVDPSSTTQAAVLGDLSSAEAPQVTREIAEQIADSILTEERVIDAIDASGELPAAGEIDVVGSVVDDYDQADRQDAVGDAIRDRVATVEDVSGTIERDRPTTRQEVESSIEGMGKEIHGADSSDVVDSVVTVEDVVRDPGLDPSRSETGVFREDVESRAEEMSTGGEIPDSEDRLTAVSQEASREIGAPSRGDYERARGQTVAQADQVAPADVLDDPTSFDGIGDTTAKTPAAVIRDESGDAVGLTGAPTQEAGEEMAREIGADYLSINEVNESIGLEQGEGQASITLRGRKIGEVDVE